MYGIILVAVIAIIAGLRVMLRNLDLLRQHTA